MSLAQSELGREKAGVFRMEPRQSMAVLRRGVSSTRERSQEIFIQQVAFPPLGGRSAGTAASGVGWIWLRILAYAWPQAKYFIYLSKGPSGLGGGSAGGGSLQRGDTSRGANLYDVIA